MPAIVIAAYNRPQSLERLLRSVANAHFPDGEGGGVPLVISIDKSGDNGQVAELAEGFAWPFGPKTVLHREEHMGLRRHILACGDLSEEYGSIILLEDDLMVSPHFYTYARQALQFYENDGKIAGVSLYNYQIAESCQYPFLPLHDGSHVYFMRFAASWGQAWTAGQWRGFRQWLAANPNIQAAEKLPHFLTLWSDQSWKRHFIRYLRATDRYFVYPRLSLSTNFGDPGTGDSTQGLFQTPLQMAAIDYSFKSMADSCAIYDECFEMLPAALSRLAPDLAKYDYETDLYATKNPENLEAGYLLSSRPIEGSVLSFGMEMLPDVANVINRVPGNFINLARRTAFVQAKPRPRHEHYYRLRSVSRHIFNDWVEQRAREMAYALADPLANELANQRFAKYVEHWNFEREFPSMLFVTPVLAGEGNAALQTAVMLRRCDYPNYRHLLLLQPGAADSMGAGLAELPNVELVAANYSARNFEFAALQQGFNHAETILMAWLPCGTEYQARTLHLVAKAFNRFAEMNWLLALPSGDNAAGYRFHPARFWATLPDVSKKRLSNGLAFWRSGLWEACGEKMDLRYGTAADLELWARFFEYEKPYVLACPVGKGRPISGGGLSPEDAGGLAAMLRRKSLENEPGFVRKLYQKALQKGFDARLPLLETLYVRSNGLPPVIRCGGEAGDSLYLAQR